MAAVVMQIVTGALDQARVDVAVERLNQIRQFVNLFDSTTTRHPRFLSYLTTSVTSLSNTSCQTTSSTLNTFTSWGRGGNSRFFPVHVPDAGLDIGIGIASNTLVRTPVNPLNAAGATTEMADLVVQIPNVAQQDAIAVNNRIDGDADATAVGVSNTTGAITYTVTPAASTTATVLLEFRMRIAGC